jgi:pimeloyl-ACP methyl ester carboxylesterase
MLTSPRLEGNAWLPDGRKMSFAEYGNPGGRPVVWMHGTPGGRRQIPQEARVAAKETNLRLISIDRPGCGHSTPYQYDTILEFATDLEVVVDLLGIDDFAMVGLSGGGPYVLASGYALGSRVKAVAVLGGVAPSVGADAADGGPVKLTAQLQPLLVHLRTPLAVTLTTLIGVMRPLGTPAIVVYGWLSPEGDKRVIARPEIRAMLLDDIFSPGRMHAAVYDLGLFGREWGFRVEDVKTPVRWWHGDADHIIPFRHGQHMVSLLPNAELFVLPGESHLGSLPVAERILADLAETWDRAVSMHV